MIWIIDVVRQLFDDLEKIGDELIINEPYKSSSCQP